MRAERVAASAEQPASTMISHHLWLGLPYAITSARLYPRARGSRDVRRGRARRLLGRGQRSAPAPISLGRAAPHVNAHRTHSGRAGVGSECALALHQWQCGERVDAFRTRIGEMRNPMPRLDVSPDAGLDTFLDELRRSTNTAELLAGIYRVAFVALAEAYRAHFAHANPLVDHPTRRILRATLADVDDAVAWGGRALDAIFGAVHARLPSKTRRAISRVLQFRVPATRRLCDA